MIIKMMHGCDGFKDHESMVAKRTIKIRKRKCTCRFSSRMSLSQMRCHRRCEHCTDQRFYATELKKWTGR